MGAIVLFLSVVVFLFSFSFSWAAGWPVRSSPFLYIPARRKRHRIIMNNLTYPPPTHSPLHSSLLLQINDRVLALLQQQQYTKPTQKKKKREKTKKKQKSSERPAAPPWLFLPTYPPPPRRNPTSLHLLDYQVDSTIFPHYNN